jgi:tetratricopeptide (TPR) repeat protein
MARSDEGAPLRPRGARREAPPRAAARRAGKTSARPAALSPALPLRHPATPFVALVAAACVVVSMSFRLYDTDMWQHLAVGRAIWTLHAFPTRQLWTWPTYGAPDVNASWGFRLLLWPVFHAFGIPGLFAWRWVTSLVAFAFLWAAARRMGARGLAPLVVIVACSLVYRQRSQVRPETLVAVLFAIELWILESWRETARAMSVRTSSDALAAFRDPRPWLVVVALLWANVHISYWMGLAVQFIYLIGDRPSREAPAGGLLARLGFDRWKAPLVVLLASGAISFVNPWGWRALWQPFDYFLNWRHEIIFQTIGELQPLDWQFNVRNGLAVTAALWFFLMLWRWRRFGLDLVEPALMLLFGVLAFTTQRFLGFYALVAVPFLGRDLDAWVRTHHVPKLELPVAARAALVALFAIAIGYTEWSTPVYPLKIGLDERGVPSAACDFMVAHGVRGRGFNQFAAGGYLAYRFWPDRTRLPFMDIHQAGTPEDRRLYALAQMDSAAWASLDAKYHFDYVLMFTHQFEQDHLLDFLDADTTRWALVSTDDAAALFVRRDGPLADVARSQAYRLVPAGGAAYRSAMFACAADSVLRGQVEAGFRRAIRETRLNTRAKTILAPLLIMDNRTAEAAQLLREALADNPLAVLANEYLGVIEIGSGRPREALAYFRREAQLFGEDSFLDVAMARCCAHMGDIAGARAYYRRALARDPSNLAAGDSLSALDAR